MSKHTTKKAAKKAAKKTPRKPRKVSEIEAEKARLDEEEIQTQVNGVINAFEDGVPAFLRQAMLDALNTVAVNARLGFLLSPRRRVEAAELRRIFEAEASGELPGPEPKPETPRLDIETIKKLAKRIVGYENKRQADALLILAREFELAGDRGPLDLEGMVIEIEEALLPLTTAGQELRTDIVRNLHASAVMGTFAYLSE